jgi:hypothetical protein
MSRPFLAPAKFTYLLRATCLDGRALPPIECDSLDEVQSKAAAFGRAGIPRPASQNHKKGPGSVNRPCGGKLEGLFLGRASPQLYPADPPPFCPRDACDRNPRPLL